MNAPGAARGKRLATSPHPRLTTEQLLRTLDLSHLLVRRLDGTILFCTPGIAMLYGWPQDEMLGKCSHSLLKTEFPQPLNEINERLLAMRCWSGELTHVRRDGSRLSVASHWSLQSDDTGQSFWVVEVSNEITRPRQADQYLEVQGQTDALVLRVGDLNRQLLAADDVHAPLEKILASVCEMSRAQAGGFIVFHRQTQTLEVAAEHGLPKTGLRDLLGATSWTTISSALAKSGPLIALDDSSAGRPASLRHLRPPGFHSGLVAPLRSGGGEALGLLAIYFQSKPEQSDSQLRILEMHARLAADCLERISAQSALRQSELLNRQIIDNIPDCIFVLDVTPDRRFKFAELNPAEEEAVGLSTTEVSGKFIEEVLPDDAAQNVIAHYRQCLEAGVPISYEGELNLSIGPRYFRTHLIPVRDSWGYIYRLVGCCHDLTDTRRNHEAALARQKLETIGLLASGIAHDFNNLLGGILASAELALSGYSEGHSVREELQRIRTASVRGGEIVRELMIYGGKESPAFEEVDVSALVVEMLELLKIAISKNVLLEADLGKGLPLIQANAAQLRQVVLNLVTNASEAIGDRLGVVRVRTFVAEINEAMRLEDAVADSGYLCLEISDTGSGIEPNLQRKIFDPFFTTKRDGRGLGLSIVQGIVRAHRGAVDLISTPGQGTSFQVFLPAHSKGRLKRSNVPGPVAINSARQPTSVLVVEDEELLRSAIGKALRRKEFSVVEAASGSEAIKLLRASGGCVDVVLLDVTLPGMPSRETYENIRRIQPETKVIFTSAYGREVVDASLGGLSPKRFIRKPFQLGELVDAITAAISE